MYLKKITLKNIKCFTNLEIDFTEGRNIRRWTTLFGQNGLGKSTLLKAIGATLAGPSAVRELMPVAEGWVQRGQPYGEIEAELMWSKGDGLAVGRSRSEPYIARYLVTGNDPERLPKSLVEHYYTVPTLVLWSGEGTAKQKEKVTKDIKQLQKTAYAEGKPGWLACGYGPFRRLSGGGQDADKILYAGRKSAHFVTLFREDAALTSATEWLIKLHNTAREGNKNNERALEHIKNAFGSKLFPQPTKLIVNAQSALLEINGQEPIPFQDLSDGYRSMLALSIDMLRGVIEAFPDAESPMGCSGVVLIDELDAHLHPQWQRQIGYWLREKFQNIQFIVATHSPFLAQVADESIEETERGSLFGGNIKLQTGSEGVEAKPDFEQAKDLRVDQILQSSLFDLESLYSPKVEEKLNQHEVLYRKKRSGKLTSNEEHQYQQLEFWREGLSVLTDPIGRGLEKALQRAIDNRREKLKELA